MSANAPAFIANGNINPSTVVKIDPAAATDFHVIQAAAGTDKPVGIATDSTYQPPGVTGSDGYAAHVDQPIPVYGEGEVCLAKAGASAITRGQFLTSDANGNVIPILYTLDGANLVPPNPLWAIAEALESANASELVRVVVRIFPLAYNA